jgi:multidrug efflux pump subunit AcrA (membrane-fusion protein)
MSLQKSNLRILSSLALITFFTFTCYAIFSSPPQSDRKPPNKIDPSVEVIKTEQTDHQVTISAQGLITASNKTITLASQVSGVIAKTHSNFIPGGLIPAGEVIVQIDQTDFEIALSDAQAKLILAKESLKLEQGQQRLAKREFALNNNMFVDDGENKALALRVPQLRKVQAQVLLAQNDVKKAEVSLQRTRLILSYDSRVLSVFKTQGELTNQQTSVGVLTKANEHWLELKFRAKNMGRLVTRTTESSGALVTFNINNKRYHGEVISLLADLVNATKMSGVIVEINMRSLIESEAANSALLIGTYISATIAAGTIHNAYAIPRESLINNQGVFVVDKNRLLQSRPATLKWESKDSAIVDIELEMDDQVITSQVFGIAVGTKVNAINKVKTNKGIV